MFKKEFRDTLRILLESSLLLLAVPFMKLLAMIFASPVPIMTLWGLSFQFTLIVFAIYSGLAMFKAERKDKGFEYLLTLPYSKGRIFLEKYAPRFLLLLVLGVVSTFFIDKTVVNWVIPLLLLQLGTVSLSLAFPTMFGAGIATITLLYFFIFSMKYIFYLSIKILGLSVTPFTESVIFYTAILLLVVPLGISFYLVFRKFDLKPYKYTVRPYFYVALPLISLQVILMFFLYDNIRYYF